MMSSWLQKTKPQDDSINNLHISSVVIPECFSRESMIEPFRDDGSKGTPPPPSSMGEFMRGYFQDRSPCHMAALYEDGNTIFQSFYLPPLAKGGGGFDRYGVN